MNTVYVTLSERVTLAAPVFLVKIMPQGNPNAFKVVRVLDVSTKLDRVNAIQIEVKATEEAEDLDNGAIYLTGGDYKYEFYESSDTVRDIDGKTFLEDGQMVFDTVETSTTYTVGTNERKSYEG